MKPFLKILLAVFFALVAIRLLPLVLASAGIGSAALLIAGGLAVAVVLALGLGVLGVVVGLLVGALCLLAGLAPVWIPILIVLAIISLCRRSSKTA